MFSTRGRGGRAGGSDGTGPKAVSLLRRISRAFPMVSFLFLKINYASLLRVFECSKAISSIVEKSSTELLYHCCYDDADEEGTDHALDELQATRLSQLAGFFFAFNLAINESQSRQMTTACVYTTTRHTATSCLVKCRLSWTHIPPRDFFSEKKQNNGTFKMFLPFRLRYQKIVGLTFLNEYQSYANLICVYMLLFASPFI